MNDNISKAMREVWEWKEEAYKDVEHLPLGLALKKRLEDSLKTVFQSGLAVSGKLDRACLSKVASR